MERPESSEVTEPSRRIYAGLEIPPIRGLRHHEVQRGVRSARGMIVAEVWVTAEVQDAVLPKNCGDNQP